jgi:adenosylcobinamide kinase/adenosylcobinamide-phosphate guanylyltransferase
MKKRERTVTLVLGGARSGKSRWAQERASQFRRVVFVATARGRDAEMRYKIARHREERSPAWKTVEAPVYLAEAIRSESRNADVVLIDCLTLYVDNVMRYGPKAQSRNHHHLAKLCEAIKTCGTSIIVVSNEVGSGIVPAFRSGRAYRELLGQLNQEVAALADNVVLLVAGIPLPIKGRLGGSATGKRTAEKAQV